MTASLNRSIRLSTPAASQRVLAVVGAGFTAHSTCLRRQHREGVDGGGMRGMCTLGHAVHAHTLGGHKTNDAHVESKFGVTPSLTPGERYEVGKTQVLYSTVPALSSSAAAEMPRGCLLLCLAAPSSGARTLKAGIEYLLAYGPAYTVLVVVYVHLPLPSRRNNSECLVVSFAKPRQREGKRKAAKGRMLQIDWLMPCAEQMRGPCSCPPCPTCTACVSSPEGHDPHGATLLPLKVGRWGCSRLLPSS